MAKKSPHEMIQDSILFGATRYERRASLTIEHIDKWMNIDPAISKVERKKRKAMDDVLSTMAFKAPTPAPAIWGEGYKELMKTGMIERKKGHTKITKTGKKEVKRLQTVVHRIMFTKTPKNKRR